MSTPTTTQLPGGGTSDVGHVRPPAGSGLWAWGHRPGLDGLRAVAVYLVVLFHAGTSFFSEGFIGVDLFFVLSGYLILNVLRTTLDRRAGTDGGGPWIADFYARRLRRLLPAASVTVVITALVLLATATPFDRQQQLPAARSAVGYYANWYFLGIQTDYFAQEQAPSPFLHFWSLAIEGQFYLIVPALGAVMLLVRRRTTRTWPLVGAFGSLLLASAAWQWIVQLDSAATAYLSTFTRAYQILAGVVLALVVPGIVDRLRATGGDGADGADPARAARAVTIGGGVLGVVLVGFVLWGSRLVEVSVPVRGYVATLLAALLILLVELAPASGVSRLLGSRPMVYLGSVSYGTYLWHWPVLVIAWQFVDMTPAAAAAVSAGVATGLAALSLELLEKPFRQNRLLGRSPRVTIAGSLAWTALLWIVVLPAVLNNDAPRRVVSLESENAGAEQVVSGTPVPPVESWAEAATPGDLQQGCYGEAVSECILVEGDGPKVHLLGDSHARTMIPALTRAAQDHGFQFSVSVAASCPWQRNYYYQDSAELRARCERERPDWYDRIVPEIEPDVLVLMNRPFDDPANPWVMESDLPELAGLDQQELLEAVTAPSLEELRTANAQMVAIEQLPVGATNPIPCVSEATLVEECSFETATAPFPTEEFLRREAESSDDFHVVDMDEVVCPRLPICDPFVDGILVRYDAHHVSVPFAEASSDELWDRITATGAVDGSD